MIIGKEFLRGLGVQAVWWFGWVAFCVLFIRFVFGFDLFSADNWAVVSRYGFVGLRGAALLISLAAALPIGAATALLFWRWKGFKKPVKPKVDAAAHVEALVAEEPVELSKEVPDELVSAYVKIKRQAIEDGKVYGESEEVVSAAPTIDDIDKNGDEKDHPGAARHPSAGGELGVARRQGGELGTLLPPRGELGVARRQGGELGTLLPPREELGAAQQGEDLFAMGDFDPEPDAAPAASAPEFGAFEFKPITFGAGDENNDDIPGSPYAEATGDRQAGDDINYNDDIPGRGAARHPFAGGELDAVRRQGGDLGVEIVEMPEVISVIAVHDDDGVWFADEKANGDMPPQWFSEGSQKVSPTYLAMSKARELSGQNPDKQVIPVLKIRKDNIINKNDMMQVWKELGVSVEEE